MARKLRYARYDIRTTLCRDDLQRFRELCVTHGISSSQLCRNAVLFYLSHANTPQSEAIESQYIKALNKVANRICALISKNLIDTRAVYRYLGELEGNPDRMVACRNFAVRQITRVLTDSERRIADEISEAAKAPRDAHGAEDAQT